MWNDEAHPSEYDPYWEYSQEDFENWLMLKNQWVGEPQDTLTAAQNLHSPAFFQPAIVIKTESSQYVLVNLKLEKSWPPTKTIETIENLTHCTTVSICDPIVGTWQNYQKPCIT